jgi:hypothetical protein
MGRNNSDFNAGNTGGAFLEGNPNKTTYSFVGKSKDLTHGLKLAGRANPHGPNTNIHVDMTGEQPVIKTTLRKK